MGKWKECKDPLKGIKCVHSEDAEYTVICKLNKCDFKEINYKKLMERPQNINGGKPL